MIGQRLRGNRSPCQRIVLGANQEGRAANTRKQRARGALAVVVCRVAKPVEWSGDGVVERFDAGCCPDALGIEDTWVTSKLAQRLAPQRAQKPPSVKSVDPLSAVQPARARAQVIGGADRRGAVEQGTGSTAGEKHEQDVAAQGEADAEQRTADPLSQALGDEEGIADFAGVVEPRESVFLAAAGSEVQS